VCLILQILPEDAHLRVSGKLHISLTRVYDRQNVIVTQFNSREELIQVAINCIIIKLLYSPMPKFSFLYKWSTQVTL